MEPLRFLPSRGLLILESHLFHVISHYYLHVVTSAAVQWQQYTHTHPSTYCSPRLSGSDWDFTSRQHTSRCRWSGCSRARPQLPHPSSRRSWISSLWGCSGCQTGSRCQGSRRCSACSISASLRTPLRACRRWGLSFCTVRTTRPRTRRGRGARSPPQAIAMWICSHQELKRMEVWSKMNIKHHDVGQNRNYSMLLIGPTNSKSKLTHNYSTSSQKKFTYVPWTKWMNGKSLCRWRFFYFFKFKDSTLHA